MLEAAIVAHALVERVLARVAEGRVAKIVRKADRLGQRLGQAERKRNRARNLGHLERMGQACPVQVALVIHEHLRLVHEAPEGSRMHDSVAITLVLTTVSGGRLGNPSAGRTRFVSRPWTEAGPRHGHYAAASSMASRSDSS